MNSNTPVDSLRAPRITLRGSWRACLLGCSLVLLPGLTPAAPGVLSQSPLFLSAGVAPNVFLLLDDSGSMDWEVLKSDGARAAHPSEITYPNEGVLDFTPDNALVNKEARKLELCVGYNALAYNPALTYTPWKGEDKNGDAFADQPITGARVNPYTGATSTSCQQDPFTDEILNTNGDSCNLLTGFSGHSTFYYPWNDDGDGVYQAGECPTDGSSPADPGSRVYVDTLSAAQRQNYANWFSYYRKREYVLKRALSEIVAKSTARVGLATINKTPHVTKGTAVGTPVKSLDDAASKAALMDNLLGLDTSGQTPLRIALKRVGDYFAGSAPTDLFGYTPGLPADSASGYSPILDQSLGGDCQQNFALVVSDGFWNGTTSPGVGNADGDDDTPYDGQSYADTYSDTLADVAMHYYETDLIPGLADSVPEVSILAGSDDNPAQHLVTFTVAFGINGDTTCDPTDRVASVASQGWPEVCADPAHTSGGSGWPQPSADDPTAVDDMRHAAWNGRGLFLSAKAPQRLIAQLDAALGDIGARTSTAAAAVALNSTSLKNGARLFQAGFDSTLWSGTLAAFDLSAAGLGATPLWEADALLDARDLGTDPRVMITFNGTRGVAFGFPADYRSPPDATELSAVQVNDLLADAPWPVDTADAAQIGENQAFGEALVAYFRGDRSGEGDTAADLRERGGLLPDIIHSAPVFVGDPDPSLYPDDIEGGGANSYQTWANVDANGRTPMVYVGTNGGALQAFEADTGREVFSYFPQLIFSAASDAGLHLLAQQNYAHRYYVDQTPTVAEVFIDSGQKWHTVLVGALRGGGKGLFALDVSDPSGFADEASAAGKVLWEFTDNNLGFTFSKPTLARLSNGKWAAVLGNGYNSDPNGDGAAKLYILYLDGSNLGTPIVLDTKAGSIADNALGVPDCEAAASDCNGLATPAVVDLGGDGIADRVYAGDLKGNLWVFDLSDPVAANWGSAYPVSGGGDPEPLFTATDGSGGVQPITTQPAVTLHPTQKGATTAPNTLVFFGTGQFLVASDAATTGVQSFYGIWDGGSTINVDRSELVAQTITQTTHTIGTDTFDIRTLSSNNVDYESKKGWYVDFLIESGERVTVNPLLFGELVVYTTIIPSSSDCGASGTSWLMVHDLFNGGEPNFIAIDVDNNGVWDDQDVTSDGHNVAGVSSGDLFWQPTIVQSGVGAEGTVLLPKDALGGEGTLETQGLRGGSNQPVRSSWARFDF